MQVFSNSQICFTTVEELTPNCVFAFHCGNVNKPEGFCLRSKLCKAASSRELERRVTAQYWGQASPITTLLHIQEVLAWSFSLKTILTDLSQGEKKGQVTSSCCQITITRGRDLY
jgi:hypothetical protein